MLTMGHRPPARPVSGCQKARPLHFFADGPDLPWREETVTSPSSICIATMALVNVVNMVVLDNPTNFRNPFQFEITFECLQELEDDLEWKVVYVGSAEDMTRDQVLDEILVGPVPVGVNKFVLQADAPDPASIPNGDILGVTVVLVTCSYKEREFIRIGYYVNNEYAEPYDPEVGPPSPLDITKVVRTILADKPRVTRFNIPWDGTEEKGPPPQQEAAGGDESMELADDDDGLASAADYEEEEEDEEGGDDDGEIDLEMLPNE